MKLKTKKQYRSFFKNEVLKSHIIKGGVTMLEKTLNDEEVPQEELEVKLNEAKQKLDLKTVKALENRLKEREPQLNKQEIIEELKPVHTLEQARQNLEYTLLKEYLKDKQKEEVEVFLNLQQNLSEATKQKLEKAFLSK